MSELVTERREAAAPGEVLMHHFQRLWSVNQEIGSANKRIKNSSVYGKISEHIENTESLAVGNSSNERLAAIGREVLGTYKDHTDAKLEREIAIDFSVSVRNEIDNYLSELTGEKIVVQPIAGHDNAIVLRRFNINESARRGEYINRGIAGTIDNPSMILPMVFLEDQDKLELKPSRFYDRLSGGRYIITPIDPPTGKPAVTLTVEE